MPSQPSLEALVARKAAKDREKAGTSSEAPKEPNMFMGIDLNLVKYNESGEATYCGLPGSGAVVMNSVGIVPFRKTQGHVPRDPIPVSQEVREVMIKRKARGFGMSLRNFEEGVFVSFVKEGSHAAKAGIRFGDQVLEAGDLKVAGLKGRKAYAHALSIREPKVSFVIRDRPLERVVDLTKNDKHQVGLWIVDGTIVQIERESSAENNGVTINSRICEINGINVLGYPDEKIEGIIKAAESPTIRFTIIPSRFYNHLTKRLNKSDFVVMNRAEPDPNLIDPKD